MIDEAERRRVAQALREMAKPTWPTLTEAVMGHAATRDKVVGRLAELIEPTPKSSEATPKCDRDALLKLANRIQHHADNSAGHSAYAARFDLAGWAEVIREACGVTEDD